MLEESKKPRQRAPMQLRGIAAAERLPGCSLSQMIESVVRPMLSAEPVGLVHAKSRSITDSVTIQSEQSFHADAPHSQ